MKSVLYLGDMLACDLAKARKDNVRLARDIAMGHQVNMAKHVAKLSRKKNTIISFTDDEARQPIHPHIDALVVTFNIVNKKVFRVLIDTGSSAFYQMNVGGATIRPIKTPLYGFGRERVYVEGAIQLPVTFGQRPAQITQMVNFLLVDQP